MLAEPKVLMPGLAVRPTHRGYAAVDLDVEADPLTLTVEVLDVARAEHGCRKRVDGTWEDSWKWRKEMLRDFGAIIGQKVFEPPFLDRQRVHQREPAYRMDLDESGQLVRSDRGLLCVWLEPDSQPAELPKGAESVTRSFGIGIDVGEGVGNSDSTIEVFAGDNREQAAELADNRITPSDLGRFAAAVARRYNDALICCVRPMHGITTIRAIVDECAYYNVWHHRLAERIYERRAEVLGWAKGESTSALLFGKWIDAIQGARTILHSLRCLQQHGQYVYDELGRITLQSLVAEPVEFRLRHGDMVVGSALAYRACIDLPLFQAVKPEPLDMFQLHQKQKREKDQGVWT